MSGPEEQAGKKGLRRKDPAGNKAPGAGTAGETVTEPQ